MLEKKIYSNQISNGQEVVQTSRVENLIPSDKRILILTPFFSPSLGGVESHINKLTEYLSKKSYKLYVITFTPNITGTHAKKGERTTPVPLREGKPNLEVRRIRWFGDGLYYKLVPYALLQFLYIVPALTIYTFLFLSSHRVYVINPHGLMAAFAVRLLSLVFRVKTVMTVHAVYNFKTHSWLRKIAQWIFSTFDVILVSSQSQLQDFKNLDQKNKLSIYTHWVDQEMFKPAENRMSLKSKYNLSGSFVVLFVGKLFVTKGVGLLIKAANKLPPSVKIVLIGSGPMEPQVQEACKRIPNLIFIGKAFSDKLADYYRLADVFIMPSIPGYGYEEGFANVVLEALSCGTPAIVSKTGSLPDIINSSVGRVINPSVDSIYETISYFYKNPEELEKLRRNCRDYAVSRFSEKNAIIYEECFK